MRVCSFLMALALVALGGCASKSYVVLLEDPQGGVGQVTLTGKDGTQRIDQAMYGADLDGGRPAAPVPIERFEKDFAAVLAASPVLPRRYLLYFQSGGSELTEASRALLPSIVEDVRTRAAADVSVIGHTDTVGAADGNKALGLKRAQDMAALLIEQGLKPYALSVESHGEHDLLIATPDDTDEPRNRRVEVSVR